MGLAAMALNFLLGFTARCRSVHAAYFGIGRLWRGHDAEVPGAQHGSGMLIGVAAGTLAAALIGALIVRLRGVYFAMVTIASARCFYFIAFRWNDVTAETTGSPAGNASRCIWPARIDIQNVDTSFYYLALAAWQRRPPRWRCCCARRSGAACWRSRKRAPGPLPGHRGGAAPVDVIRGLVRLSSAWPGRCTRC